MWRKCFALRPRSMLASYAEGKQYGSYNSMPSRWTYGDRDGCTPRARASAKIPCCAPSYKGSF